MTSGDFMNLELIGIPNQYFGAATSKIKNLSPDQYATLSEWARSGWRNCIFYGDPGRGKTYAAVALMQYFKSVRKIPWHDQRFVNMGDLNQLWLSNMSEYSVNYSYAITLKEARVLVIDDLGLKKPSDSFLDYLFNIIDRRCLQDDLITIYSTNLEAKQLNEVMGARVMSRISDGIVLKFEGPDLRRSMPRNSKIEPIGSVKIAV